MNLFWTHAGTTTLCPGGFAFWLRACRSLGITMGLLVPGGEAFVLISLTTAWPASLSLSVTHQVDSAWDSADVTMMLFEGDGNTLLHFTLPSKLDRRGEQSQCCMEIFNVSVGSLMANPWKLVTVRVHITSAPGVLIIPITLPPPPPQKKKKQKRKRRQEKKYAQLFYATPSVFS